MTDIMQRFFRDGDDPHDPDKPGDSPLWIEQPGQDPRPLKWGELHTMSERWTVHHKTPTGILSTCFLGFRTYGGHLYETAFFPDDPNAEVCILARYRTRADAEAGHRAYLEAEGVSTDPTPTDDSQPKD